jgi:ABC-type multidrug transport system ATPase subunit
VSQPVVETCGVGRRFGARLALASVDLAVPQGAIVGIAGPNGAGKSTLLHVLAGLLRPSTGTARVFGLDPNVARAAVMRRARFAFAPPGLWPFLSAREHVVALARLSAPPVSAALLDAEIDAALDLVGLRERQHDRAGSFSFGMRQRLALAIALCPRPELLVLDEPAEGLDPLAVLELRAILARLRRDHGVTVLLSSHLLLELDALVDELVVLEQGEVLCAGAPEALRGSPRWRLVADAPARAAEALAAAGLAATAADDGSLWLAPDVALDLAAAQRLLAQAGVALVEFARVQPSLEQALLARLRARRSA